VCTLNIATRRTNIGRIVPNRPGATPCYAGCSRSAAASAWNER
jgi:hypothetical protein